MAFKYLITMFSTNFELEPVIKKYIETYPDGDWDKNYQIVFTTQGEQHPDSKSYLIVRENHAKTGNSPEFFEYLKSYCVLNNLVAVANPTAQGFPEISGINNTGQVFGQRLKK